MDNPMIDEPNQREEIDELETRIQGKLGGRIRRLRLEPRQGGLILRGWTETYYAKQLAQQAVLEATNMPLLANEIEVK